MKTQKMMVRLTSDNYENEIMSLEEYENAKLEMSTADFNTHKAEKFLLTYEDDQFDDIDSLDEETQRELETGNLCCVVVTVTVFDASGLIEGVDCLGGVLIRDFTDIISAVLEHDMIENAQADLEKILRKVFELNKKPA